MIKQTPLFHTKNRGERAEKVDFAPLVRGDSPQCGEMSRSDRGVVKKLDFSRFSLPPARAKRVPPPSTEGGIKRFFGSLTSASY